MLINFLKIHTFQLVKFRPQHLFSQKKFSKFVVDAGDYLKETSFDTNLKTEWSEKEKRMQAELDSKSQNQSKIQDELRETEAEFEEAG